MLGFVSRVLTAKGPCLFATGQAGYIIKSSGGQLFAIDLYLSNCVERIEGNKGFKRLLPQLFSPIELKFDGIICTHAHLDHFDIDAVPEMVAQGARLFCSVGCAKLTEQYKMDYYSDDIVYVRPGDKYSAGDFEISFVNCDHGAAAPDAVGVIVKVDGKTIYEVGDSCLRLDRVEEIPGDIDVLIAPINGMFGNMNAQEVSELAAVIKPGVTIPCHYGMFASHGGDLKRFYDTMTEKELPFLIMQQGERYTL